MVIIIIIMEDQEEFLVVIIVGKEVHNFNGMAAVLQVLIPSQTTIMEEVRINKVDLFQRIVLPIHF